MKARRPLGYPAALPQTYIDGREIRMEDAELRTFREAVARAARIGVDYAASDRFSTKNLEESNIQSNTTGLHNLDFDAFLQFYIPLPPLSVQREIVARLERELGAVEKVAKAFEELERAAEGEFKAELKETFEEISRGGAETRRLGDVCELIGGFAFKSTDYSADGRYRVVNIGCVQDDWFDAASAKRIDFIPASMSDLCRLVQGDLLMSLTGNIGRLCYVGIDNGLLNQRVAKIVPKGNVEKSYLCYLLRSPDVVQKLTDLSFGAAQLNISPVKMRELDIPSPPLPIQCSIVARLDAARERKERLMEAAKKGREAAALWRKAILKEAFE